MHKDIRFLLVFLIIAIGVLVWLQCYQCNPVPNSGSLNPNQNSVQGFAVDNKNISTKSISKQNQSINPVKREQREQRDSKTKFIDDVLKSESRQKRTRFLDKTLQEELDSDIGELPNDNYSNPLVEDVNQDRNSLTNPDQKVLDQLIKEVTTGNDLIVDNPREELYKSRSRSINSNPSKKYRNVSYKDSEYRYDFNDDGSPSQTSQDELNSMYDDALVFRNNEYNTNGNFKGYSDDTDQIYGSADLNNFKPSGQQTQEEKIMALYNSNEYLPNNNMLDKKLTKGFQILDNPVAVSNPNLIPVLKSIPVSSVMGSNRNQTYDIRAEPPCPRTVVSPFLNSSIMPDIYSTQRGCL